MIAAAALLLAAGQAAPAPAPATATFDQLKQLVGVWRNADKPDSALRIRFSLTAGGTVLVESWERAGDPHSLTLYHRDGAALLATHYCPQGNQPRMALVDGGGGAIHFAFRDVTDLDPGESHQHDLWLDLSDPARPVRSEVYLANGKAGPREQLRLERVE